ECAHVTADNIIPAFGFDSAPNRVPDGAIATSWYVYQAHLVHAQEAVDRHPGQHFGVSVVEAPASNFPDALVRLLPAAADGLADALEHPPRVSVEPGHHGH